MDVTFILQGITNPEIDLLQTISEYRQVGKVILSIYRKKESPELLSKLDSMPDLLIIDNDQDEFDRKFIQNYGPGPYINYHKNIFFQVQTVLAALPYVTTKYCIKVRVDHYYANISQFARLLLSDKIVSSSLFVRGFWQHKFHLSDCLFGGLTCEIFRVFALSGTQPNIVEVPEIYIWKPYILEKLHDLKLEHNTPQSYAKSMSEIFIVYPICTNPYKIHLTCIVNIQLIPKRNTFGSITHRSHIHTNIERMPQTTYNYFLKGILHNYGGVK